MTRAARSHRISSFDAHSSALFTCRSFTSSSFELIPSLIPYFLSFFLLFTSPLLSFLSFTSHSIITHLHNFLSLSTQSSYSAQDQTHSLTQSFTHPPALSCSLPFPIIPSSYPQLSKLCNFQLITLSAYNPSVDNPSSSLSSFHFMVLRLLFFSILSYFHSFHFLYSFFFSFLSSHFILFYSFSQLVSELVQVIFVQETVPFFHSGSSHVFLCDPFVDQRVITHFVQSSFTLEVPTHGNFSKEEN